VQYGTKGELEVTAATIPAVLTLPYLLGDQPLYRLLSGEAVLVLSVLVADRRPMSYAPFTHRR